MRLHALLVWCLVAMLAGPLSADDKNGKGKNASKGLLSLTLPKSIKLSSDQQTKFKALRAEYGAKFADIQKKLDAILTPELRRQMKELGVAQVALAKEAQAKLLTVLTDEQKASFKKGGKPIKGYKSKGDKGGKPAKGVKGKGDKGRKRIKGNKGRGDKGGKQELQTQHPQGSAREGFLVGPQRPAA